MGYSSAGDIPAFVCRQPATDQGPSPLPSCWRREGGQCGSGLQGPLPRGRHRWVAARGAHGTGRRRMSTFWVRSPGGGGQIRTPPHQSRPGTRSGCDSFGLWLTVLGGRRTRARGPTTCHTVCVLSSPAHGASGRLTCWRERGLAGHVVHPGSCTTSRMVLGLEPVYTARARGHGVSLLLSGHLL